MIRALIFACLSIFPFTAYASDPTPLVEIFVEWPLLFLSGVLLLIAYLGLRHSLVANLALLFFQFLVLWWLVSAEYMANNGDNILISLSINVIGVGLGVYKISRHKKEAN